MRILLCAVFFIISSCLAAGSYDPPVPDYWQDDDLGSLYDYADDDIFDEPKQEETDKQVEQEIQNFIEETDAKDEDKKQFDAIDYQIEDNRVNSFEKEAADDLKSVLDDAKPNGADSLELDLTPIEALNDNNEELDNDSNAKDDDTAFEDKDEDTEIREKIWDELFDDEVDELPFPEADETQLNEENVETNNNSDEKFDDEVEKDADNQPEENIANVEDADFEQQIDLNNDDNEANAEVDSKDSFEQIETLNEEIEKAAEDLFSDDSEENFEEDTPEKVYADIDADLDKLFETLDKLTDSSLETSEVDKKSDDVNEVHDDIKEDYENIGDSNLSEIFKNLADASAEQLESKEKDEFSSMLELLKNNSEELPEPDNELPEPDNDNKENNEKENIPKESENQDELDYETFEDDDVAHADEEVKKAIKQIFNEDIKELPYGDDGLTDEGLPKNEDAEVFDSFLPEETNATSDDEIKSVLVDDLTSAQLSDLMAQFAIAHAEDLDVHSANFTKDVAPIHITLSVDEPVVITSPNYPDPYPTNNIIDWVFEGPGTGIELNITDFALNGALGDYLLVKPGGLDESGTDGLIFSYRLESERKYRFTDVNRMFVRFEAKLGMMFLRGFKFSVKMIWPLPLDVEEEAPAPEPVIRAPEHTTTVYLGGISVVEFPTIRADLVQLIADMATDYIQENEIDMGNSSTINVTQITGTGVCNIHWPDHRNCVQVTFGVPLEYEDGEEPRLNEDDLKEMWSRYIVREQFASRLSEMGVTEFAIPDDDTILTIWLVIAFGVVIAMSLLAFALWRFSCFQDYTRMTAYSDTDSLKNEKRNLDLYPTPHQTLPPLYTENDYKWADNTTRVDMGGFANKSYIRDDLFDFDSDEDVVATRDRYSNV